VRTSENKKRRTRKWPTRTVEQTSIKMSYYWSVGGKEKERTICPVSMNIELEVFFSDICMYACIYNT